MPLLITQAKNNADIKDALKIRHKVFVEGQNVPLDREIDGLDEESLHYLASADMPVGAARVRLLENNEVAKIERVAILGSHRGKGYGRNIMQFILEDLRKKKIKTASLASQTHALPFYESLGFEAYGDEFMDANIPHFNMKKNLG